jgi:hypothetical protein
MSSLLKITKDMLDSSGHWGGGVKFKIRKAVPLRFWDKSYISVSEVVFRIANSLSKHILSGKNVHSNEIL